MRAPWNKNLVAVAVTGLICLTLVSCGKTKRSGAAGPATAVAGSTQVSTPPVIPTPPPPPSPSPTPSGGSPVLSYEFVALGNATFTTPAISTDNLLRIRFVPGTTQDNAQPPTHNATHQATELSVVLAVNGQEQSPTYTSSNYTYGRVNEQSNIVDFSSALVPAMPVTITVKFPKNDFYCTYLASTCGVLVNSFSNPQWRSCGGSWIFGDMVNTLANQYPGCRKPVWDLHRWSGKILVQTSNTVSL